jgi:hypothetical protein
VLRRRIASSVKSAVRAVLLLCVLGGAAALAVAAGGSSAPTTTSAPANPTRSTSAQFAFVDSQHGERFACSLDGSSYSTCTSGVMYSGLAQGAHTFSIEAKDQKGMMSGPKSYSWRVDRTPPRITLDFPRDGGSYNAGGWQAGCSSRPGICGSATDPSEIAAVAVSIRQNTTGKYWSATGFTSSSEMYRLAALSQAAATTTTWFYPMELPAPDGSYSVHVVAIDKAGNITPLTSPVTSVFTIKTTSPPAPVITSAPPDPSTSNAAQFSFSDGATGVTFQCQLDAGGFGGCASPVAYGNLSAGSHTFSVRAVDAAGNVSSPTPYSWVISPAGEMPFSISGNPPGLLYPGAPAKPIALKLSNENSAPIYVTRISVTAQSLSAGCDAGTNFRVIQSSVSASQPVLVPAESTVTPTGSAAPTIQMLNTDANQNACEGVELALSYSGSAHS